jgi:aspartyl/asparaginyl beta-hydroxylase (cupin superfamily)
MRLDVDIKKVAKTDLSIKLKKVICKYDEEWNQWMLRQETFFQHRNTKSFPLFWPDENNVQNNVLNILKKNKNSIVWDIVENEFSLLSQKYDGIIVRAMFANLLKGKSIDPHVDGGFLLENCHRLHLPIITNKNIDFIIENTSHYLREGIWYEFNNVKVHSVHNKSDFDRIHLMVDIIPNSILNQYGIKINYT